MAHPKGYRAPGHRLRQALTELLISAVEQAAKEIREGKSATETAKAVWQLREMLQALQAKPRVVKKAFPVPGT